MRAFIDRIESGIATMLLGEDESVTVRVPAAWLPEGAREGVVLQISCIIDTIASAQARSDVQTLIDSLPNEP